MPHLVRRSRLFKSIHPGIIEHIRSVLYIILLHIHVHSFHFLVAVDDERAG